MGYPNQTPPEKTTLVVDGNWLLMGRQFMLREKFSLSNAESIRLSATNELADLMAQSISVCLRGFGSVITNIVFVADGGSWRKSVDKPGVIDGEVYKGTRSLESNTDWTAVWSAMGLIEKRLRALGVTVCVGDGVEGDDWCWWWSRTLNARGENVILWTVDEDIKQLVQADRRTGCWTGWYERKRGLVLHEKLAPQLPCTDEDDITWLMMDVFKESNPTVEILEGMTKVSYINPTEIINKKIFVGDNGDNILPAFTYTKNGRTFKATLKDLEKVMDMKDRGFEYDNDWEGTLKGMYKDIMENKKNSVRGTDVTTEEDFIDHVKYNRKVVWLDESQYPDEILRTMQSVEYHQLSENVIHDLRFNWKTISDASATEEISALFDDEDLPL